VGLAQRVLEASGIATVTLSWIPELTRAVGVPRLAGIGYPAGQPLGRPHDPDGQRAVLRATLEVLASAAGPDGYVELPFQWPESPARARNASRDVPPSPIEELLRRKPWLVANLYSGRIPLKG
jgi:D-proline reductase (dithiol) PrdB